ncbi:MAG: alpha/beta hydrolase [Deltaproteobacteria bacterium]|nr:alpha/beta hydrolase [Deltaproteobacteria bacterium]
MTTLRDADMPPCPDALDPDVPLSLLATQLMKLRSGQMYLFPLLYRASRCSAEDQMVIPRITALRSVLVDPGSSLAAFVHIGLQLGLQSSAAEAEAFASTALFDPGLGRLIGLAAPVGPTVDPDPVPDAVPESDAAILMLNGTLDPQTPIEPARAIAARLAGPHRGRPPRGCRRGSLGADVDLAGLAAEMEPAAITTACTVSAASAASCGPTSRESTTRPTENTHPADELGTTVFRQTFRGTIGTRARPPARRCSSGP